MGACQPLPVTCADPLASAAQRMHPSLQQVRTGQGFRLAQADAGSQINYLLTLSEQNDPDARADYWPTRVWRQLIWQPAYLAVVAVHGFSAQAPLQGLLQRVGVSGVSGYRWLTPPTLLGDEKLALKLSAAGLANFSTVLLALLQRQRRVSSANCKGLLADCIFFGLQALAPQLKQDNDWIARQGESWCRQTGLLDKQGEPLSRWHSSGRLVRRSCCKSFLVGAQIRCDSCPLE